MAKWIKYNLGANDGGKYAEVHHAYDDAEKHKAVALIGIGRIAADSTWVYSVGDEHGVRPLYAGALTLDEAKAVALAVYRMGG